MLWIEGGLLKIFICLWFFGNQIGGVGLLVEDPKLIQTKLAVLD